MITVKRESDLEMQEWTFRYSERDHMLALTSWKRRVRSSCSHEFRDSGAWTWGITLRLDRVPPDVLDEARHRFVETLKVDG